MGLKCGSWSNGISAVVKKHPYMRYVKTHRNMAANRPSIVWVLTSLASLESWHSQLFNDTKIIAMRPILMHFVAIFWFLVIFGRFFSIKKSLFWRILVIFWYENDQKSKHGHEMHQYWLYGNDLASLDSWECQLSNDAKLVKIRPIEGHILIWKSCFFTPRIRQKINARLQCRSIKIHTSM